MPDAEHEQLTVDVSSVRDLAKGKEITLEIDYSAAPSASLIPIPVRKGDPIAVRTVYTVSEPLGAASWMPCHNTPSDRVEDAAHGSRQGPLRRHRNRRVP